MPRLDQTGPQGLGQMTGRGLGPCGYGRGFGRMYAGRGLGRYFGQLDLAAYRQALTEELEDVDKELADLKKSE